jgi:hypothetical protein
MQNGREPEATYLMDVLPVVYIGENFPADKIAPKMLKAKAAATSTYICSASAVGFNYLHMICGTTYIYR